MKEYRLDKTAFKMQTFEEADMENIFKKDVPVEERLRLAFDLVCTIYGIKDDANLKIDRTFFLARKFNANA